MLQMGFTEDNTGINPYGRALYDFNAQYPNELSFCKDEIIYLVKHIDSHWTVGMIDGDRGLFPTSYVEIIVDCVNAPVESFLLRPLSAAEVHNFEGYAVVLHDYARLEYGDVTVSAMDSLKVMEPIDDNWALVEVLSTGEKGMCPTNHFR